MRKITKSAAFPCVLLSFLSFSYLPGWAQKEGQEVKAAPAAAFALQEGDRVVFLGNSLFENDLPYGYLELALTTRWPNRQVSYRNIAWTGDTVWGDARSYITNPPTPYELLIDQLTKTRPTVVFIAYGGIEAQEGEAGLPHFQEGLNKLLDKVSQLGAKAILLSPIPVLAAKSPEELATRNAMLQVYGAAIARTASAHGQRYVDVFNPILEQNKKVKLSDNDIHLNETGYYYLAAAIENKLGLPPRHVPVSIQVNRHTAEAGAPVKMLDPDGKDGSIKFTIAEGCLPLPLPSPVQAAEGEVQVLKITGLKKGFYTLSTDDFQVVTASADTWQQGVEIRRGAAFHQASQLQAKIIKKNDLFFQQYRPQNKTYILGFRSYEQGRHVKTLEDMNFIITWLEGQIALNRAPKSHLYQLSLVK